MNTHAVYFLPTGAVKSTHPDASSAYTAAARLGGEKRGYVVGPAGCPPKPQPVEIEDPAPEAVGPGLFE